jgi:hypothetical protein
MAQVNCRRFFAFLTQPTILDIGRFASFSVAVESAYE